MKNSFGSAVTLTIFGESHGAAVGAVLDGLAAGFPVDEGLLARHMDRRRAKPGGLSTGRTEADRVRFLSGLFRGRTAGTPLTMMIENTNARSADYGESAGAARPGHADWTAHLKYQGFEDFRGGGHFSGRVTAALTAAGGICAQILAVKGIRIGTHIARIGAVQDAAFLPEPHGQLLALQDCTGFPVLEEAAGLRMQQVILEAAEQGDSVGGVLETAVTGLPGGVGEPFFDSVESVLSHLLFSIPAVKGVEFGDGFGFAGLTGSQANDPLILQNGSIRTSSNHNGGINGGIANGMPLLFRCCIKPTPSIFKPQQTVDLTSGQPAALRLRGRHDPCILHRAAIVQTSAAALGLLDLCTQRFGTLWQTEPAKED